MYGNGRTWKKEIKVSPSSVGLGKKENEWIQNIICQEHWL
jgi:hypothetical protein